MIQETISSNNAPVAVGPYSPAVRAGTLYTSLDSYQLILQLVNLFQMIFVFKLNKY